MAKEQFQKKQLDPNDHKDEVNTAKMIRDGITVIGLIVLAVKAGPKLIKEAISSMIKV